MRAFAFPRPRDDSHHATHSLQDDLPLDLQGRGQLAGRERVVHDRGGGLAASVLRDGRGGRRTNRMNEREEKT